MDVQTYVVVEGSRLLYSRDLGRVHFPDRPRPGDRITVTGDEYVIALVNSEGNEVVGVYVTAYPPKRAPAPAPPSAG